MSSGSRGLGRGLDALFQHAATDAPSVQPGGSGQQKAHVDALTPNPQQPRRQFSDPLLEELAASIKVQGVLQPILVRSQSGDAGQYEIIAGERRWRAAKLAGLTSVPIIVKEMNDQEVLVVALMENLQREDLTPIEEAMGLQQLKEEFGFSQEDMAHRLGKSRSAVANTLRLLTLPELAREDLVEGRLSAGHARALLMITDPECQEILRQHIVASHCTVREAERLASVWKDTGALPEDLTMPMVKPSGEAGVKTAVLDESLQVLQERLGQALSLPVTIKGKENKGRVSVAYASKEELEMLLSRLGISGEA